MRRTLQRRTVYAATIVAILAMVGGFALAAATTQLIPTAGNQNGFTAIAPGNTIYGSGTGASVSSSLVNTTATGTCGVVSVTSTTATVYLSGGTGTSSGTNGAGVACQTVSADWFEEFTFTSNSVYTVANPSDTFNVFVAGYTSNPQTFTAAFTASARTTVITDVFVELGTSATLTNGWVSIAVSGS